MEDLKSESDGIEKIDAFKILLDITDELERRKIYYTTATGIFPRTVLICVAVPGSRWEIEVTEDGSVEIEKFSGGNGIWGPERLSELYEAGGD